MVVPDCNLPLYVSWIQTQALSARNILCLLCVLRRDRCESYSWSTNERLAVCSLDFTDEIKEILLQYRFRLGLIMEGLRFVVLGQVKLLFVVV